MSKLPQYGENDDKPFGPELEAITIKDLDETVGIALSPLGDTPEQTLEQFAYAFDRKHLELGDVFAVPTMDLSDYAARLKRVMVDWYAHTLPMDDAGASHGLIEEFGRKVNACTSLYALTGLLFEEYDGDRAHIIPQLLAAANVDVRRKGFWLDATA